MIIFVILAAMLAAPDQSLATESNPIYAHQKCVNTTALKLIKSGEVANLIVDAAMTKCAVQFSLAADWMNAQVVKVDDNSATALWFRKTTKRTLDKQAREEALLKVLEAKAK